MFKRQNYRLLILIIIFAAAILRFTNLMWGNGYFPHPDERNIASLAESTNSLTKGTYSYGNFLTNFSHIILVLLRKNSFVNQIFFLRLLSAFFSTATVIVVYFLGKVLKNKNTGLLVATLATFSPGLIQAAHFGTFESYLILLQTIAVLTIFYLLKKPRIITLILFITIVSAAAAVKINSVLLFPLIILPLLKHLKRGSIASTFIQLILAIIGVAILTVFLSPYYTTKNFLGFLHYESSVVSGTLDVFYTRQFLGTTPFLFGLEYIMPWITNPLIVILFPIAVIYLFIISPKSKRYRYYLVILYFLLLFIPSSITFAKWTRFLLPSIIPIILLVSIFLTVKKTLFFKILTVFVVMISFSQGLTFLSIYTKPDVRLTASRWIRENIPPSSYLFSETANVIDIPLPIKDQPNVPYTMIGFDFYNIKNNPRLQEELVKALEKADYILIPSRRLFMNQGRHPKKYPYTARYYNFLFSDRLGFEKIAEFTSFPSLTPGPHPAMKPETIISQNSGIISTLKAYFILLTHGFLPDETAEETWTVFDHPVIRVYRKTKNMSAGEYKSLLGIL